MNRIAITKLFCLLTLSLLTNCTALPELAKTADDILTDKALSLTVDKEALQKQTDIHILIDILNKDPKQP